MKLAMTAQTSKNFGVIWDLDNTLYQDETPAMDLAYEMAATQAALDCDVPLTFDAARNFAHQAYASGTSYREAFVAAYGIDGKHYHQRFHELIDHTRIDIPAQLRERFKKLDLDKYVLLTHSSRYWAEKIIGYLGLSAWFPSSHILTLEDCDYEHKSSSTAPFLKAMAILDLPPAAISVVEDSAANLVMPFRLGMRTIHLHYGKALRPKPNYIATEVGTLNEAFDYLQTL